MDKDNTKMDEVRIIHVHIQIHIVGIQTLGKHS
jgi:hypothetical protein